MTFIAYFEHKHMRTIIYIFIASYLLQIMHLSVSNSNLVCHWRYIHVQCLWPN